MHIDSLIHTFIWVAAGIFKHVTNWCPSAQPGYVGTLSSSQKPNISMDLHFPRQVKADTYMIPNNHYSLGHPKAA